MPVHKPPRTKVSKAMYLATLKTLFQNPKGLPLATRLELKDRIEALEPKPAPATPAAEPKPEIADAFSQVRDTFHQFIGALVGSSRTPEELTTLLESHNKSLVKISPPVNFKMEPKALARSKAGQQQTILLDLWNHLKVTNHPNLMEFEEEAAKILAGRIEGANFHDIPETGIGRRVNVYCRAPLRKGRIPEPQQLFTTHGAIRMFFPTLDKTILAENYDGQAAKSVRELFFLMVRCALKGDGEAKRIVLVLWNKHREEMKNLDAILPLFDNNYNNLLGWLFPKSAPASPETSPKEGIEKALRGIRAIRDILQSGDINVSAEERADKRKKGLAALIMVKGLAKRKGLGYKDEIAELEAALQSGRPKPPPLAPKNGASPAEPAIAKGAHPVPDWDTDADITIPREEQLPEAAKPTRRRRKAKAARAAAAEEAPTIEGSSESQEPTMERLSDADLELVENSSTSAAAEANVIVAPGTQAAVKTAIMSKEQTTPLAKPVVPKRSVIARTLGKIADWLVFLRPNHKMRTFIEMLPNGGVKDNLEVCFSDKENILILRANKILFEEETLSQIRISDELTAAHSEACDEVKANIKGVTLGGRISQFLFATKLVTWLLSFYENKYTMPISYSFKDLANRLIKLDESAFSEENADRTVEIVISEVRDEVANFGEDLASWLESQLYLKEFRGDALRYALLNAIAENLSRGAIPGRNAAYNEFSDVLENKGLTPEVLAERAQPPALPKPTEEAAEESAESSDHDSTQPKEDPLPRRRRVVLPHQPTLPEETMGEISLSDALPEGENDKTIPEAPKQRWSRKARGRQAKRGRKPAAETQLGFDPAPGAEAEPKPAAQKTRGHRRKRRAAPIQEYAKGLLENLGFKSTVFYPDHVMPALVNKAPTSDELDQWHAVASKKISALKSRVDRSTYSDFKWQGWSNIIEEATTPAELGTLIDQWAQNQRKPVAADGAKRTIKGQPMVSPEVLSTVEEQAKAEAPQPAAASEAKSFESLAREIASLSGSEITSDHTNELQRAMDQKLGSGVISVAYREFGLNPKDSLEGLKRDLQLIAADQGSAPAAKMARTIGKILENPLEDTTDADR